MLVAIAEGTQALIELNTYKKTNLAYADELVRKDQLIASLQNERKLAQELADALQMQMITKDEIITTQRDTIKRVGTKKKTWGLGANLGYGYSFGTNVQRGVNVSIGITKTFLRF